VRDRLARIALEQTAFDVRFGHAGRFPTVVYLAPDPSATFAALTGSVAAAFPAFQPYGGVFDEVIPHLTLVESAEVDLQAVADAATDHLPFTRSVAGLEVLVKGPDGRWHPRWRLPLGGVRPSD